MKSRFLVRTAVVALASTGMSLSQFVGRSPLVAQAFPPANPINTTFYCVPQGNGNYAATGVRGTNQTPLIIFTQQGSSYFGGNYPPETRCSIVANKLNGAVQANGGSLANLFLTNGRVNGEMTICVLRPAENFCHGSNVLLTLKPENANRAGEVLGQILQISRFGSTAGVIYEDGDNQTVVNLGDWEAAAFGNSSPINSGNNQPPINTNPGNNQPPINTNPGNNQPPINTNPGNNQPPTTSPGPAL